MKIFFGGTFINKEDLEEVKIKHPIKLEYYKRINEEEFIKNDKAKYGISVIKTEYISSNTKVENKDIPYVTNDERKIDKILKIFKDNIVTPIAVEDIISDFSKEYLI